MNKIAVLFGIFALFGIFVAFSNFAFAVPENSMSDAKTNFPESVKIGERVPFSLKMSNLEYYRVSDIEPIITIMLKSASKFVHVEINPQISTLWDGFYQNTNGTIYVDKGISVDRIFVSVSFMGKNPDGEQVSLTPDSTFNASIRIEKESPHSDSMFDLEKPSNAGFYTQPPNSSPKTLIVQDIPRGLPTGYTLESLEELSKYDLKGTITEIKPITLQVKPVQSDTQTLTVDEISIKIKDASKKQPSDIIEFLVFRYTSIDLKSQPGHQLQVGNEVSVFLTNKEPKSDFVNSYAGFVTNKYANAEGTAYNIVSTKQPSPLMQLKSGIYSRHVNCNEGLELLIKQNNGQPICVKPYTKSKLLQAGVAEPLIITEEGFVVSKSLFPPSPLRIEGLNQTQYVGQKIEFAIEYNGTKSHCSFYPSLHIENVEHKTVWESNYILELCDPDITPAHFEKEWQIGNSALGTPIINMTGFYTLFAEFENDIVQQDFWVKSHSDVKIIGLEDTYKVGDNVKFYVTVQGFGMIPCEDFTVSIKNDRGQTILDVPAYNHSCQIPVEPENYQFYFPQKNDSYALFVNQTGKYTISAHFGDDSLEKEFVVKENDQIK